MASREWRAGDSGRLGCTSSPFDSAFEGVLRILIVSDMPPMREFGSAQLALGLADGLRELGHEVVLWSPETVPGGSGRWRVVTSRRAQLEAFLERTPAFDIVDASPLLITARVAEHGPTVARTVQPELEYLRLELKQATRQRPLHPSTFVGILWAIRVRRALEAGWGRASSLACLGSLDAAAVLLWNPALQGKVGTYFAAPNSTEREALRAVRSRRTHGRSSEPVRFLWIGRWAAHKGTAELVTWIGRVAAAGLAPRVTIAGCGEAGVRSLPAAWIASGRIEVVPEFSRADLPALLERHDAGLFTSLSEGWGLSLQEMLESGMPVYAAEVGAVPDLKPWLAPLIRPFPPIDSALPDVNEGVDWTAYEERFAWPRIARDYESLAVRLVDRRAAI